MAQRLHRLVGEHLPSGVVAVFTQTVAAGQVAVENGFYTADTLILVVNITEDVAEQVGGDIGATLSCLHDHAAQMCLGQGVAYFFRRVDAESPSKLDGHLETLGGFASCFGLFVGSDRLILGYLFDDVLPRHVALGCRRGSLHLASLAFGLACLRLRAGLGLVFAVSDLYVGQEGP